MYCIHTSEYHLTVGDIDGLLAYNCGCGCRVIKGPVFAVDGTDLTPDFASFILVSREMLTEKITEYGA